jgi:VanZ family protein
MKKRTVIFLIITLAITAFIFSNSLKTAEESAEISTGLLTVISGMLARFHIGITHHMLRKAAHFTEFFMQGAAMVLLFSSTRLRFRGGAIYVAFFGLFTGCCDELLQLFSAGRGSQVSDVFVDFSGTLTAVIVFALIFLFERRRKSC